jgi:hypothetical protein
VTCHGAKNRFLCAKNDERRVPSFILAIGQEEGKMPPLILILMDRGERTSNKPEQWKSATELVRLFFEICSGLVQEGRSFFVIGRGWLECYFT